ncbi:MAG TPA: aromatic ring-hydroxylating dioxygenase subunit alpha [Allosphingosinicella sp.]|jgi:Rieske 2Fe-2S family protein
MKDPAYGFTASPSLGLAREAYFSKSWYEEELSSVFYANWTFAGILADVPNSGDYLCLNAGTSPLFVIRTDEGELKAFHNICRHRGTTLLRGRGNTSDGIQCGYHCWRYDLEGALRSVPRPHQFPGLKKTQLGLHPASVALFKGMIFVHPEERSQSDFEHWLGEFPAHFGPYDLAGLQEVLATRRPMKANWKLFVENHIESYHLWYAHRRSILGLDHNKQVNHYYNGHWSFFEPTLIEGRMAEFESNIPSRIIAPDPLWFGSGDHLLYPNLGIVTGAKFVGTLKVIPTGPITSEIEMRLFGELAPQGEAEDTRYGYYDARGSSEGTDLNGEDIELCERVQEGLGSPRFAVGALAREYEQSIAHFHEKYRAEMSPHSARRTG